MPQPKPKPKSRATAMWLATLLFVAAWMFVLGILVGRGTAPLKFDLDKLQKELTALKAAVKKNEERNLTTALETLKKKTELAFFETLKEKRDPERPPAGDAAITPIPDDRPAARPTEVVPPATRGTAARAGDAGTPPPAAARSTKTRRSTAGKSYAVQVASLKAARDADRLVSKLRKQRFTAYRMMARVADKGIWFRVRIGPFASHADAAAALARLKQSKMDGFVMQVPPKG